LASEAAKESCDGDDHGMAGGKAEGEKDDAPEITAGCGSKGSNGSKVVGA
jgi:hypothetical protein